MRRRYPEPIVLQKEINAYLFPALPPGLAGDFRSSGIADHSLWLSQQPVVHRPSRLVIQGHGVRFPQPAPLHSNRQTYAP
jgi:hypothetical protein